MNHLERFRVCMDYGTFDPAPYRGWGPWLETLERWLAGGHDPDHPPFTLDPRIGHGGWFRPVPPFAHEDGSGGWE